PKTNEQAAIMQVSARVPPAAARGCAPATEPVRAPPPATPRESSAGRRGEAAPRAGDRPRRRARVVDTLRLSALRRAGQYEARRAAPAPCPARRAMKKAPARNTAQAVRP